MSINKQIALLLLSSQVTSLYPCLSSYHSQESVPPTGSKTNVKS